jgi:hypothetical protein
MTPPVAALAAVSTSVPVPRFTSRVEPERAAVSVCVTPAATLIVSSCRPPAVAYCNCTQSTVVLGEKARFSVPSWSAASCAAESVSSREVALASIELQPREE